MSFYEDKPTHQLVAATVAHYEDLWRDVYTDCEEAESYYYGTFKVFENQLDTRTAYHPPKARAIVDHAVDTQLGLLPSVSKTRRGEGEDHNARADACEVGIKAVLKSALWDMPMPITKMFFRNVILYGIGNLYTEWEEPYEKAKPKRKGGETDKAYNKRVEILADGPLGNPIKAYSLHPKRMLVAPGEATPSCAIIKGQRYACELNDLLKAKRKYGHAKDVRDGDMEGDPYRLVDTWEWKTAAYNALFEKGGESFYVEENPFGVQTVHIGYSGWGGEVANDQRFNPKYYCVGILAPVYESLRTLAMKRSAARSASILAGIPRMGTKKPVEEVAAAIGNPKAILEGEEADYWVLNHPQVANYVFDSSVEEHEIDEATYQGVVSGAPSAVDTVGQEIIRKNAAERKFNMPKDQLERTVTMVASDILAMVDVRNETIKIGTATLSPENIDGSYEVECLFRITDPLIELRQQEVDMQKVKMGLMSEQTFWESHNVPNVTEERDRLDMQMLRQFIKSLPPEQNPILQRVLVEGGFGEMMDSLKQALSAAAQQGAAPAAAPPGSTRPGLPPAEVTPNPMVQFPGAQGG